MWKMVHVDLSKREAKDIADWAHHEIFRREKKLLTLEDKIHKVIKECGYGSEGHGRILAETLEAQKALNSIINIAHTFHIVLETWE